MDFFASPIDDCLANVLSSRLAYLRAKKKQDKKFTEMYAKHFHCPNLLGYYSRSDYLHCPFCEENRAGKKPYHKFHLFNHASYQSSLFVGFGGVALSKREYLMKKPQKETTTKKGDWCCPDQEFKKKYPTLAQHCCDGWWEDGKPRELCTISINFSLGSVTLSLADKNFSQSVYTTAGTLSEALGLLEECLADGSVTWRPWKRGK